MRTAPFSVESLLQPLSEAAPSGPDLEYDPAFVALEKLAAGKPERQYGDKVYPAELPDWGEMYAQAIELGNRTRDLRVAVWLLRAATRLHGLGGAVAGLQLIAGLLQRLWPSVHPQLDAGDPKDPTIRLSTLAPLASAESVLADLYGATLVPVRGSLTLRELALGMGRAHAVADEPVPTEAGVLQALQALLGAHASLAIDVADAAAAVAAIAAALDANLGADHPADLAPLTALVHLLTDAIGRLQPAAQAAQATSSPGDAVTVIGPAARTAAAIDGSINCRADVMRALDKVCEWLEHNEPGHPAPLLIRRSQRLMNKTFLEIIRDLAPEGLRQVENLAGSLEQS